MSCWYLLGGHTVLAYCLCPTERPEHGSTISLHNFNTRHRLVIYKSTLVVITWNASAMFRLNMQGRDGSVTLYGWHLLCARGASSVRKMEFSAGRDSSSTAPNGTSAAGPVRKQSFVARRTGIVLTTSKQPLFRCRKRESTTVRKRSRTVGVSASVSARVRK